MIVGLAFASKEEQTNISTSGHDASNRTKK